MWIWSFCAFGGLEKSGRLWHERASEPEATFAVKRTGTNGIRSRATIGEAEGDLGILIVGLGRRSKTIAAAAARCAGLV